MVFDANIPFYLYKRQSNISNYSNSIFFKKKFISSVFESSNNLYSYTKNWCRSYSNFYFSNDGNYFSNSDRIFKLNQDLFIENSVKLEKKLWFDNVIAFNNESTKLLVSIPQNENIIGKFYVYDIATSKTIDQKLTGLDFVNISTDTYDDNIFAACSTTGNVYVKDLRCSKLKAIYEEKEKIKSAQFHPKNSNLLLFVPRKGNEIFFYDTRNHQSVFYFDSIFNHKLQDCESTFNKKGDQILVSFKNSNPVVYEENNPYPIYEFDHFGFKNFISSKPYLRGSCFAGSNDEFVVCSSKDCNVYVWKIPNEHLEENKSTGNIQKINSAKFVLKHDCFTYLNYSYSRSIITCLDREFKFWCPFKLDCKQEKGRKKKTTRDIFADLFSCIRNEFNENFNFSNHKEYFNEKFEITKNIFEQNILDKFEKDLNVSYIKRFIENYTLNFKQKNSKIIENLNKFSKDENLKLSFFFNNHSFVFELIKVYKTKHFIEKSIFYLNKQFRKLEELQNSVYSEIKDSVSDVEKKLVESEKIKIILKSMVYDLEIIVRQNYRIYEKPIELAFSVIKTYFKVDNKFYSYFAQIVFEESEKFKDPGVFIDEESMTSENEEKNLFLKTRVNRISNFFEKELNKSITELNENLLNTEKLLISLVNKKL